MQVSTRRIAVLGAAAVAASVGATVFAAAFINAAETGGGED